MVSIKQHKVAIGIDGMKHGESHQRRIRQIKRLSKREGFFSPCVFGTRNRFKLDFDMRQHRLDRNSLFKRESITENIYFLINPRRISIDFTTFNAKAFIEKKSIL